jgi:NAD(P)-dependent dehydrogenase (short-subunit alcohol dehydrogenase family)
VPRTRGRDANAGFSWFGPTAELDVATFDRLFAANVRAAYFLVGAATLLAWPAKPGEIAGIIAFLASPKASYITGAVIAADGGQTAI